MLISMGIDSKKRPKFAYNLLRPLFATSHTRPRRGARLLLSLKAFRPLRPMTSCDSQRRPALIEKFESTRQLSCTYAEVFLSSGVTTSGAAMTHVDGFLRSNPGARSLM